MLGNERVSDTTGRFRRKGVDRRGTQSSCKMKISKEKQKLELSWDNNVSEFHFAKIS